MDSKWLALPAWLGLLLAGCNGPPDPAPADPTPTTPGYAHWQGNEIRSLAPQTIEGLRTGAGLGYALAAELNGYPGPKHVLELADQLQLTPEQRESARSLAEATRDRAVRTGESLVQAHLVLEEAFRSGTATQELVQRRTSAIAALDAELRSIHLEAHVAMRGMLDATQVARYQELRGYTDSQAHP